MFVKLTEDMLVHNEIVDGDHRQLVRIINDLHAAVSAGLEHGVIEEILGSLADYVAGHFYREENLMERIRHPELVEHVLDHWRFTERLTKLIHSFEMGNREVASETLNFLLDWFGNHIQTMDKKIVDSLPVSAEGRV
jgi:hemerythrin